MAVLQVGGVATILVRQVATVAAEHVRAVEAPPSQFPGELVY